jgi:elongation factor 2 kinase
MGRDQGVEDGSPTSSLSSSSQPAGPERRIGRRNIVQLLHRAARQLTAQQDPWKDLGMDKIPAERAVRWFYDRPSQSWSCDETIVKIQPDPFTKGAMRSCYRLKKRASFPKEATNTRFHKFDWKTSALNYVAKAYLCPTTGDIDASESAKAQVRNDIVLQHEAQHWATQFNHAGPPTQIVFLRAYALEFVTRPNQPWMAVERYITGRDSYGASFVKHNTNAGFVDRDLRRVTPQVFSAHTFYASNGTRT